MSSGESRESKPMTIKYDGETNCAFSVTNLDQSLAWYRDILGLEISFEAKDMGWVEFKTPTPGLTLGISQVEKVQRQGGGTLVFGVTDLDKTRIHLESKSVRFDGETQVIPGMAKLATFFDPDGNTLMLSQTLS